MALLRCKHKSFMFFVLALHADLNVISEHCFRVFAVTSAGPSCLDPGMYIDGQESMALTIQDSK